MKVSCPTCKKSVVWAAANKFKPFCSERCRLIDLGAWASEEYKVPTEEVANIDDPIAGIVNPAKTYN